MVRSPTLARLVPRLAMMTTLAMPLLATAETSQPSSVEAEPHADDARSSATATGNVQGPARELADGATKLTGPRTDATKTLTPSSDDGAAPAEAAVAASPGSSEAAPSRIPSPPGGPASAAAAAPPAATARQGADRTIDGLTLSAHAVQRRLRIARAQRDVPRVRCLDDMLSRLHMATRQGREMRKRWIAAVHIGDAMVAEQEQTRITWLHERAARLAADARRCEQPFSTPPITQTGVWHHVPSLPSAAHYPAPPGPDGSGLTLFPQ